MTGINVSVHLRDDASKDADEPEVVVEAKVTELVPGRPYAVLDIDNVTFFVHDAATLNRIGLAALDASARLSAGLVTA